MYANLCIGVLIFNRLYNLPKLNKKNSVLEPDSQDKLQFSFRTLFSLLLCSI